MTALEDLSGVQDDGFVVLDGDCYYRICSYDRIAPFLMSIPSDTDLWMFVASGGGLTAGRTDADGSLFPYETVDRLHDAHHHTGPVTIFHVDRGDGSSITWEPFANPGGACPHVDRYLYKNTTGNRVVFEEYHRELRLSFRYRWSSCDEYGWIRSARLSNHGTREVRVRVMDGLRNIMPPGVPLALQQQSSNLVDAYKTSEIDPESGLGIFSLSSKITDRAEALESLRANVVWSVGLDNPRFHMSTRALMAFRDGRVVAGETALNGARGNYFVSATISLAPDSECGWHIGADTGLDHPAVAALHCTLLDEGGIERRIEEALDVATSSLRANIGSADGIQLTGSPESWAHHFSNVLFNNMRGGVFAENYEAPRCDLLRILRARNSAVADRFAEQLQALPEKVELSRLLDFARSSGDASLERLCFEYLPLYFSRRHGDPSRPWNRFAIRTRNDAGERELNFEGNWRDLFQNWEALARSFPRFLPGMVAKFVNASTADGFNPYRLTGEGAEWEIPLEDDPWSNIGYWGDHQIIYLLKLLEALERFSPESLGELMGRDIFSYVEVPYRLVDYDRIVSNAFSTIEFDHELEERIERRVAELGSDGKLMRGPDGSIYHVNLFEKLLVPVLSKLSNLVPGAGIWMNTQRPEWNDANNALAGGGISVVTLCYLRRHLTFLAPQFEALAGSGLKVSAEVVEWFGSVDRALASWNAREDTATDDPGQVKSFMDEVGRAFSDYRHSVYASGFSGKAALDPSRAAAMCRSALAIIDASIEANRREDGLFHTYNRLAVEDDGRSIGILRLPQMLEGQVAVLSSGYLHPEAAIAVLRKLFDSPLYDRARNSFVLYPARDVPGFMDRNVVPESGVSGIGLLERLLAEGDTSIVQRDPEGVLRFSCELESSVELDQALAKLALQPEWADAVDRDRARVAGLYDEVFGHKAYTGRSGVMYGFEGIGCIYWHMVAKLLLAVQENYLRAEDEGLEESTRDALATLYYRVRAGLGFEKTAEEFGAFPTDPYSHTPSSGGARQPGMTGQVKEEILSRSGELGVRIEDGAIEFRPSLLRPAEWLESGARFRYFDVAGAEGSMALEPGSIAFTLCQVPVVYRSGKPHGQVEVEYADGTRESWTGTKVAPEVSALVFARNGRVKTIRVDLN